MLKSRLAYLNRVIKAYLTNTDSHLTFWHGTPTIHPEIDLERLGPYYMKFAEKAMYSADLDESGIPMLEITIAIWNGGTKKACQNLFWFLIGWSRIWRSTILAFMFGIIILIGNIGIH